MTTKQSINWGCTIWIKLTLWLFVLTVFESLRLRFKHYFNIKTYLNRLEINNGIRNNCMTATYTVCLSLFNSFWYPSFIWRLSNMLQYLWYSCLSNNFSFGMILTMYWWLRLLIGQILHCTSLWVHRSCSVYLKYFMTPWVTAHAYHPSI